MSQQMQITNFKLEFAIAGCDAHGRLIGRHRLESGASIKNARYQISNKTVEIHLDSIFQIP